MRSIARWFVSRTSRRRVLVALAVMVLVQALGAIARMNADLRQVTDFMPDIHPGYDGPGLLAMIGSLAGHPMATWVTYGFDVLNPTTGGAFYGLLLANLLVATRRQDTRWQYAIPLLLLGLGLDLVENAVVLGFVAIYPSELIATLHLVLKLITWAKFGLFGVGFGSLAVLTVAYFRRERAPT